MDIRQYFKPKSLNLGAKLLPSVSKATIRAVEKELEKRNTEATSKRVSYIKISDDERAKIGGYAAKFGVTATIRHFKRNNEYPDLKESTVRGWKNVYQEESKKRGSRKRSCSPTYRKIELLQKKFFLIPISIGQHQEKVFVALSWSVK